MEKKSLSKFLESNGSNEIVLDSGGKPIQGEVVTGDGVILRFVDGLLDGNMAAGYSLPAVEAPGHLEWWQGGNIHRAGGLPAVISNDFEELEWWENGKKLLFLNRPLPVVLF
jgi:hypothetical protein